MILFFWLICQLEAAPRALKQGDIHKIMEELFTFHVEYKELTPLIVKRSFKVYIEQFDPARIYLLNGEVNAFLEFNADSLASIIDKYHRNDFSDYQCLNQVIVNAITRARAIRQEIRGQKPLVVGESYGFYAKNLFQLKERIANQYAHFLKEEGFEVSMSDPMEDKFFHLWEKRLRRGEDSYLEQAQKGEHFATLHLLKALAKSLDAHTSYYSPEEAFELRAALEKQFEGLGVVLREGVEGISIVGLIQGGPAAKSQEIKEGDLIEMINGIPMKDCSYEEVLELLKGRSGVEVVLGLKRRGALHEENRIEVRLKRDKIVMQEQRVQCSVFPFADGIIGQINLPSFYEAADGSSCEKDLKKAVHYLNSQGKVLGLVMDLRENSGGFLNQAVKVGGLFITNGVVVISKYAEGEVQYLRAIDGRATYAGPLVILTSKASASAAEIVAQALQDYGVALIVGDERTYGKGSIQYQTVTENNAKAYFKVTVGRYYTVSGKSTQIEGVQADIHVPTAYAPFRIGERFLDYPLPRDQMFPVFVDPLSDLEGPNKEWFQKHYLPYLHKKESFWHKMLPTLQKDSSYRLAHDKNFSLYMQSLEKTDGLIPKEGEWGTEDLQMKEALQIVQDMILLQAESSQFVR